MPWRCGMMLRLQFNNRVALSSCNRRDMIFINAFHPAAVVDACHIYNQVLSSYHNYKINYACEEIAPTEPARA